MTDQLTATIIPFPVRTRAPVQADPSSVFDEMEALLEAPAPTTARTRAKELSQSSQRLTEALADLSAALVDQREATQRWKQAIEDLASKMRSLGDTAARKKIS